LGFLRNSLKENLHRNYIILTIFRNKSSEKQIEEINELKPQYKYSQPHIESTFSGYKGKGKSLLEEISETKSNRSRRFSLRKKRVGSKASGIYQIK